LGGESQRRGGLRSFVTQSFLAVSRLEYRFDNSRVVAEMGEAPAKFSTYAAPLLKYCRENKFHFPAKPWPAGSGTGKNAAAGRGRV